MESRDNDKTDMKELEELQRKQAEMPLPELLEKCKKELSKLCKTGGKSIHMSVPPSINDTDMLLSEALRRLHSLSESHKREVEEAVVVAYGVGCLNAVNVYQGRESMYEDAKDYYAKTFGSETPEKFK